MVVPTIASRHRDVAGSCRYQRIRTWWDGTNDRVKFANFTKSPNGRVPGYLSTLCGVHFDGSFRHSRYVSSFLSMYHINSLLVWALQTSPWHLMFTIYPSASLTNLTDAQAFPQLIPRFPKSTHAHSPGLLARAHVFNMNPSEWLSYYEIRADRFGYHIPPSKNHPGQTSPRSSGPSSIPHLAPTNP